MIKLKDLSTDQILKIIAIKKKIEKLLSAARKRIEKLQGKIDSIAGNRNGVSDSFTTTKRKKRRRHMSVAGRAAISAAVRARWAAYKGKTAKTSKKPATAKKRKKFSAAARAKLAAAARARWVKARAAGKTTL
jgi:hypothetical protein